MLDELFTFPIVLIDGDNENKKRESSHLYKDDDIDIDMIFGEAEYPFTDFMGIEDRWLPSSGSLNKALDGKFDACVVNFARVGQLLVPWSKKKFKAELIKFAENYDVTHAKINPEIQILKISPEQLKELMENKTKQNEQE